MGSKSQFSCEKCKKNVDFSSEYRKIVPNTQDIGAKNGLKNSIFAIILEPKIFFQESAILQRLFDRLAMLQYIAILQRLLAMIFLQYCRGKIQYLTRSVICLS